MAGPADGAPAAGPGDSHPLPQASPLPARWPSSGRARGHLGCAGRCPADQGREDRAVRPCIQPDGRAGVWVSWVRRAGSLPPADGARRAGDGDPARRGYWRCARWLRLLALAGGIGPFCAAGAPPPPPRLGGGGPGCPAGAPREDDICEAGPDRPAGYERRARHAGKRSAKAGGPAARLRRELEREHRPEIQAISRLGRMFFIIDITLQILSAPPRASGDAGHGVPGRGPTLPLLLI